MESLGDSITTAVLLHWNKNPGDVVKEDDVIAVVETDKVYNPTDIDNFSFHQYICQVTMDIRAKKSGIFVEGLSAPQAEVSFILVSVAFFLNTFLNLG